MALTAILDIDGTLVDTNYHHAIAWFRALRSHGAVLPLWQIHRHIGMGGDQLVSALAGDEFEKSHGDAVRETEGDRYMDLIGEVQALPGARELLVTLKERGHSVVLASSAKAEEVEHYVDLLDARELADSWTTSADVETTKPAPDLVESALDRGDGNGDGAVMVGDSTFDCEAAGRADVPTIGVLTGGFSEEELREAGAVLVFESPAQLLERLGDTPLG
jgi:phosphoglycolate phosphatase-like HAD superfamily hydrolase